MATLVLAAQRRSVGVVVDAARVGPAAAVPAAARPEASTNDSQDTDAPQTDDSDRDRDGDRDICASAGVLVNARARPALPLNLPGLLAATGQRRQNGRMPASKRTPAPASAPAPAPAPASAATSAHATPPQLDLFEHSRDTMLRNDVLDALLHRQPGAATSALQALADDTPGHAALAPLAVMVQALRQAAADANTALQQHGALAQARTQLQHSVAPAAHAMLGSAAATTWLQPLWRALAMRADKLPFDAQQPDDHAATLWLQAGAADDAASAVQALQAVPSWRRMPVPLAWMAQARYRLQGLDSTWPLLAELAWLAPARLAGVTQALQDPLLQRLLQRFEQDVDLVSASASTNSSTNSSTNTSHPLAWLPAWLLIDQPALLERLREARTGQDSPPERSFRLLVELLGLERQGRQAELIGHRRRLRDAQPVLFDAYLRRR